jgi:hypothetical protein
LGFSSLNDRRHVRRNFTHAVALSLTAHEPS